MVLLKPVTFICKLLPSRGGAGGFACKVGVSCHLAVGIAA